MRFAHYLHRRFAQSRTPKHYLSDLHRFIHAIDEKTPEAMTAAKFVEGCFTKKYSISESPRRGNSV
jgi:hypothetical protein